ncbi:MAG: hypothetical protein QG566_92 [Patescibacteria group bacterium]|nr:hypothetical protein [Patescibacteria group bacterium]
MKKIGILIHGNQEMSVNGFTLADLNQILAFELVESRFRPDAHMANILFGPYCLDESKNKERTERPWEKDDWGYMDIFMYSMDIIAIMIHSKNMFTLSEFYSVLFSNKTLREVLSENSYFPEVLNR